MINYHGRLFRPVSLDGEGDVSSDTIFRYSQRGDLLTADYSGGEIDYGHIIGLVDDDGNIDMRYHHITLEGDIMTGRCRSKPEVLPSGKLRIHERWQWTCGDRSNGQSILEEL